ncbi:hypothetical protein FJT64_011943 [Amphibalanus amphitrite]|uniref:Uncharacterized protein n=1 Tax=Amphibalanus amphitrite TaxID=1232801 RepID=A0A6A4VF04_AMPAM|nr:hypothetical protein FJT64_011943 [Amphibalanus amphitrite]
MASALYLSLVLSGVGVCLAAPDFYSAWCPCRRSNQCPVPYGSFFDDIALFGRDRRSTSRHSGPLEPCYLGQNRCLDYLADSTGNTPTVVRPPTTQAPTTRRTTPAAHDHSRDNYDAASYDYLPHHNTTSHNHLPHHNTTSHNHLPHYDPSSYDHVQDHHVATFPNYLQNHDAAPHDHLPHHNREAAGA